MMLSAREFLPGLLSRVRGGGVLPYKGLMGMCDQPGYVFQDFCLKQGIEFIIFCLNQDILSWTKHPDKTAKFLQALMLINIDFR